MTPTHVDVIDRTKFVDLFTKHIVSIQRQVETADLQALYDEVLALPFRPVPPGFLKTGEIDCRTCGNASTPESPDGCYGCCAFAGEGGDPCGCDYEPSRNNWTAAEHIVDANKKVEEGDGDE